MTRAPSDAGKPDMLDGGGPIPLYVQVADIVTGQIHEGALAAGDQIPRESELRGNSRGGVHRTPGAARAVVTRRHYERLMAHPISASLAREHVVRKLIEWQRRDLITCAELIVGELAANAITATTDAMAPGNGTRTSAASEPVKARTGFVGIGVYQIPGGVVVEVWDCSLRPPKLIEPSAEEIGGRGLVLVDALSKEWGYRRPVTGGKIVYATIEAAL